MSAPARIFPSPVAKQWGRVPEGRVRALRLQSERLLRSSHLARKSPHPASRLREAEAASLRRSKVGHLPPCFAREKGKRGRGVHESSVPRHPNQQNRQGPEARFRNAQ